MEALRQRIEAAFEARQSITPSTVEPSIRADVETVINMLDRGEVRVAEKIDGQWHVNQWLKKAVLLSFRIFDNQVVEGSETKYFDKVPMKFADYDEQRFIDEQIRVVPPAAVRKGSFIAKNTVLMPSYVNLGAYVGEGT
ncbi:MAG: 2,3,4,5-tetrahydropyridine-2,6-dicarboxylate N-succinyltransferase, partial [Shewanella sp.]|nr:2,3,4,5-tetrahydropyridine-2,6-dicarboxylate N-succinyltransferase [Shewanella sp.]